MSQTYDIERVEQEFIEDGAADALPRELKRFPDDCERIFMSKHEAFCAGIALGEAPASGTDPRRQGDGTA